MKRRRSSVRFKLMLAGLSFLGTLLLVELAARVFRDTLALERENQRISLPLHYPLVEEGLLTRDPDGDLRYRLTPNFKLVVGPWHYRINSLGLRGPETPRRKPPQALRVLLLGDSYAFGLGVDQADTLAAQLQSDLRTRDARVEVLDLGVPGYHSGQQLAQLESLGFELDPDLVILLYFANDEVSEAFQYDPCARQLYADTLPLPHALKGLLRRSALYRRLILERASRQLASGELLPGEHHWPRVRERLAAMASACRSRGVPFLLANLPNVTGTRDLRDPGWSWHANYERVATLAGELDIPWVDLREVLRTRPPKSVPEAPEIPILENWYASLDPLDYHFNALGYAALAEAIATAVAQHDLLGAQ